MMFWMQIVLGEQTLGVVISEGCCPPHAALEAVETHIPVEQRTGALDVITSPLPPAYEVAEQFLDRLLNLDEVAEVNRGFAAFDAQHQTKH